MDGLVVHRDSFVHCRKNANPVHVIKLNVSEQANGSVVIDFAPMKDFAPRRCSLVARSSCQLPVSYGITVLRCTVTRCNSTLVR